jgi:hypothetical protein
MRCQDSEVFFFFCGMARPGDTFEIWSFSPQDRIPQKLFDLHETDRSFTGWPRISMFGRDSMHLNLG